MKTIYLVYSAFCKNDSNGHNQLSIFNGRKTYVRTYFDYFLCNRSRIQSQLSNPIVWFYKAVSSTSDTIIIQYCKRREIIVSVNLQNWKAWRHIEADTGANDLHFEQSDNTGRGAAAGASGAAGADHLPPRRPRLARGTASQQTPALVSSTTFIRDPSVVQHTTLHNHLTTLPLHYFISNGLSRLVLYFASLYSIINNNKSDSVDQMSDRGRVSEREYQWSSTRSGCGCGGRGSGVRVTRRRRGAASRLRAGRRGPAGAHGQGASLCYRPPSLYHVNTPPTEPANTNTDTITTTCFITK